MCIEWLDTHFLQARAKGGPGVRVVPLLLVHGWSISFVEFYDLLLLLTSQQEDNNVAFEVVCPSIPGYGFSQASAKRGAEHDAEGERLYAHPGHQARNYCSSCMYCTSCWSFKFSDLRI